MAAPDAGPLRMMATLGLAGMLSGLVLVGVHRVTAPRIERNKAEALERAVYRVVPGAEARAPWVLKDGRAEKVALDAVGPKDEVVWEGLTAAGERVGFAIPAEGPGFQDTVGLIYGYDPARRRVIGMEVLESRETPGLGDKIIKDMGFVGQFKDLAVDPLPALVKPGKGTGAPHEVDAISGATISSKAVVNIIGAAHSRWDEALGGADAGADALEAR